MSFQTWTGPGQWIRISFLAAWKLRPELIFGANFVVNRAGDVRKDPRPAKPGRTYT